MPELISPHAEPHLRATFLEAMREFENETGRADADGLTIADLETGECVESYTKGLRNGGFPRPGVRFGVPDTVFWWCDTGSEGRAYIGRVCIRHFVARSQWDHGGQLWLAVRPSRRREGHATRMLTAAMPSVYAHGVEKAEIICPEANVPARRLVEAAGATLDRIDGGRCWYYLPITPPTP